jgi:2-hydroxychromene-2-carboxylate isomerase
VTNVDFYYSIGSRYSYLAATQIAALKTATACHIEWYPIDSKQLIAKRETSPFDGTGQYAWDYRELDASRWANYYGVKYHEPRGRVTFDSALLARACIAAKQFGKIEDYSHLLFAEMFHTQIPTTIDDRTCLRCAEMCSISIDDFQAVLTYPETVSALDRTIDLALELSVFGVPTFITDGELFWGNDRLILLEHHLQSISSIWHGFDV